MQALHRCIRETGYASASLTAIAVKAGMSPSHIRYYFENKDAILEYYLHGLCRRIIDDLQRIPTDDRWIWLDQFCDYYIRNPRISRVGLGVLVEVFGVSVHQPALHAIKAQFDNDIRALLQGFFEDVGCASGVTPELAAEIAQAVEVGVKYNAVFQKGYDPLRADAIFVAVIRSLAGAEAPAALARAREQIALAGQPKTKRARAQR